MPRHDTSSHRLAMPALLPLPAEAGRESLQVLSDLRLDALALGRSGGKVLDSLALGRVVGGGESAADIRRPFD